MSKCTHISLNEYPCPNPEFKQGLCALHSRDGGKLGSPELERRLQEEINRILETEFPVIVFEDVSIPGICRVQFEHASSKPMAFTRCEFFNQITLPATNLIESISFADCRFSGGFALKDAEVVNGISFEKVEFHNPAFFHNLKGDFRFHMAADHCTSILLANMRFTNGLDMEFKNVDSQISLTNIGFVSRGAIRMHQSGKNLVIRNCQFLKRTDIMHTYHPQLHDIKFEMHDCSIDNLYANALSFSDDPRPSITVPQLLQSPSEIMNNFKSFYRKPFDSSVGSLSLLHRALFQITSRLRKYRDPEFASFVDFIRRSKDYYSKKSEYTELFNLYERLDLFFSRLKPEYQWQKRIINNCYRWLSSYGYDAWKPIIWLVAIIIVWSIFYVGLDYYFYREGDQTLSSIMNKAISQHLTQLTFMRSPDNYFKDHIGRAILLLLETLILIPIIATFVVSIRKVFKRT